jgi:hypothetical protein
MWRASQVMKKDWPRMNADERRFENKMLIGVHLRLSSAQRGSSAIATAKERSD